MNLCKENKALSLEVKNFILNVRDAKEESITDYLVWKWREMDPKFKCLKVSSFTRHQERNISGADIELELWLVGAKHHFSLVFQAKKFIEPYGAYFAKLNYPTGTQQQLATLLTYANKNNKLPFYLFYSIPDVNTRVMCRAQDLCSSAIFMADAYSVKSFADGVHGTRFSKNKLLRTTNPLHCLFCCPLRSFPVFFKSYFPSLAEIAEATSNEVLPQYVRMLLDDRVLGSNTEETLAIIHQHELCMFRSVGVYDMRSLDDKF